MQLVHEFSVPVPVDQAWQVLTDVERIAPCLPGAELTGVDGDAYHGQVKIKVGPITAQYRGTASFAEKDEARHRVVLKASGRETRGQGNAAATVTAEMAAAGGGTTVSIVTDLSISGRVAQFGRGVMGDVSARLLEQFVRNLETGVLGAGQPRLSPAPPHAKVMNVAIITFLADERRIHQQRTRAGWSPGSPNRAASTRKAPGAVPCSQAGNRSHPGT